MNNATNTAASLATLSKPAAGVTRTATVALVRDLVTRANVHLNSDAAQANENYRFHSANLARDIERAMLELDEIALLDGFVDENRPVSLSLAVLAAHACYTAAWLAGVTLDPAEIAEFEARHDRYADLVSDYDGE